MNQSQTIPNEITFNLRQTTCEGVYFWSRDTDSGDVIWCVTHSMQTSQLYLLQNWSYWWLKFYITGIGNFTLFSCCDLDLSDLQIQTWPVSPKSISSDKKWTSYIKAFESYRITHIQQTDVHTDANETITTPLCGWYIYYHATLWLLYSLPRHFVAGIFTTMPLCGWQWSANSESNEITQRTDWLHVLCWNADGVHTPRLCSNSVSVGASTRWFPTVWSWPLRATCWSELRLRQLQFRVHHWWWLLQHLVVLWPTRSSAVVEKLHNTLHYSEMFLCINA